MDPFFSTSLAEKPRLVAAARIGPRVNRSDGAALPIESQQTVPKTRHTDRGDWFPVAPCLQRFLHRLRDRLFQLSGAKFGPSVLFGDQIIFELRGGLDDTISLRIVDRRTSRRRADIQRQNKRRLHLNGLREKAAIDAKINASDKSACASAGQKHHGADQFLALAETGHRRVVEDRQGARSGRFVIVEEKAVGFARQEKIRA